MYLTKLHIVLLGLVALLWFILYQSNEYYFYDNPPNTECAICMDEFTEANPGITSCHNNHQFHRDCINTWIRTRFNSRQDLNCPVCRADLKDDVIEQSGVAEQIRLAEQRLAQAEAQRPYVDNIRRREEEVRQAALYRQLLEQQRREAEEELRNRIEMMQERILQQRHEQIRVRYNSNRPSSTEDNFFIGLFIGYLVLTFIIYVARKVRGTPAK